MIYDYLEFLSNAWPSKSQLLICEPGIGPFIGRFCRAHMASGLHQIKKLHKTQMLFIHGPHQFLFYALPPKIGPDPAGPGVRATRPKIACKEFSGPWNICANLSNGPKVTALFWSDTRMDGHTDARTHRQKRITLVPLQNFFFAYMWGERRKTLKPLRNFYLFTWWITICNWLISSYSLSFVKINPLQSIIFLSMFRILKV